MMARSLASRKVWRPGPAAAVLVGVVLLLVPSPDSAAHDGHTDDLWKWTWRAGSTERLAEYQFWHYNAYREQRCTRYNHYTGDCDGWTDTGQTRERPQDACAARPEWVEAAVVGGNQQVPSAPSGSTCNRHDSYLEGANQWVFDTHETVRKRPNQPTRDGALRCRLPGSGIQSATTNTNTSPPGGSSVVYTTDQTRPDKDHHCGYWSGPVAHTADVTPITEPEGTTTTTEAGPGNWSGSCSYDFTVGTSASQPLPTYSDSRVSGYSYSGTPPAGMSMSGSSSLTLSGRPSSITGTLAVSRGTITASISGGDDETLACVFRVRTTTVTTEPERPPVEAGWSGECYEELELGEYYGTRQDPEIYLPYYLGSSWDDRHSYSGQRPRGIFGVSGDGEAALAGTALQPGTFNGWVNARVGRVRHRAPCVIYVDPGRWVPEVCEFFLEVDRVYDITMPYLVGPRVDSYYSTGSLPPGLTQEGYRIKGIPAVEGVWSPNWVAAIADVSSRDRPSTTCTFYVEQSTPPGWSGICDWTFTVGNSYTRILPVADTATIHLWTGDVPEGMRMRFVRTAEGVYTQQLSGTPTSEGTWTGTLTPYNTSEDVDPIDCSFEVLPGPDIVECSRTIPSDQIDAVRDAVEWRTDVPRAAAHSDIPGGTI